MINQSRIPNHHWIKEFSGLILISDSLEGFFIQPPEWNLVWDDVQRSHSRSQANKSIIPVVDRYNARQSEREKPHKRYSYGHLTFPQVFLHLRSWSWLSGSGPGPSRCASLGHFSGLLSGRRRCCCYYCKVRWMDGSQCNHAISITSSLRTRTATTTMTKILRNNLLRTPNKEVFTAF